MEIIGFLCRKSLLMVNRLIFIALLLAAAGRPQAAARKPALGDEPIALEEVVVSERHKRALHMLAYVREYSSITSNTDTVFLFREKMVDFMLPTPDVRRFEGWDTPRVLKSESFLRFTDSAGLDSVSDSWGNHFSWSDWVGLPPQCTLPSRLGAAECGTDTLRGRYSPAVVWCRNGSRVDVRLNVLNHHEARKWVPGMKGFFTDEVEFDTFKAAMHYDNVVDSTLSQEALCKYEFEIESRGRGRQMFSFSRHDAPYDVSTRCEVFIIDKEYISIKEARRWAKHNFEGSALRIIVPREASGLEPEVAELVGRVRAIDKMALRLPLEPDSRLAGHPENNKNFRIERRALTLIKQLTGIEAIQAHRNANRQWRNFSDQHKRKQRK